ncbi:Hypothetical protein EUBREC_1631 [Agathobacter rectalis ATCC 33656]|uniref:Uncharacterized protein n=1 Tax=Agathobacter rectalis (strain ATCC 33656 / DSM 3377 / JCM 17463 / KCTC 5835 / VPI 0990) TaxID=515619 RepID=C4Z9F3_AGARV|nr:Hypothetical protein EUBREC_1631 [Agathobacter rectalis ATCC 33656]
MLLDFKQVRLCRACFLYYEDRVTRKSRAPERHAHFHVRE